MMQLLLKNGDRVRRVDWRVYALFRDNVQHYLEHGQPRPQFQTLHALEDAVDGAALRVPTQALRQEIQAAWPALEGMMLKQCAISLRTRALMTGCRAAPSVRGTVLARLAGWELPVRGEDRQLLYELLGDFVNELLWLTQRAGAELELIVSRASTESVEDILTYEHGQTRGAHGV